ncbi:MAG: hypothetical protein AAF304_03675 [Pseudomonadota bacterium]
MNRWLIVLIASLYMSVAQAASVIPNLTYVLSDHPDAVLTNLPDVTYGIRLDQLGGSDANRTFSTTQDGALTTLFWDDMGNGNSADDIVSITGTVSRNSDNSIWNVSYTLTGIIEDTSGFVATAGSGALTNGAMSIQLIGEANIENYVFLALGDGHRISGDNTSEVGRGWLEPNSSTDDWLVRLTPVPIPAALPLFFVGLLSIFGVRKFTV